MDRAQQILNLAKESNPRLQQETGSDIVKALQDTKARFKFIDVVHFRDINVKCIADTKYNIPFITRSMTQKTSNRECRYKRSLKRISYNALSSK